MQRRMFLKKAGLATAGAFLAPYILPSGRLFAKTGSRIANHVVYVLFAGGIRNQESVDKQYLLGQGIATTGNVMRNMLDGAAPSSNLVYTPWAPVLSTPLAKQGTLFKEVRYTSGPTGHYNGHTVAMTGNYTETGLNLNINPASPTVFEYYRKHTDPATSAMNAWWLSEGLGPYPSLNYSQHELYGSTYGANYLRPATIFGNLGTQYLSNPKSFQPDDVDKIQHIKAFLDNNFGKSASDLPGIMNTIQDRESIKNLFTSIFKGTEVVDLPLPNGVSQAEISGDLLNIAAAWKILDKFTPELTVVNTFNLDVCHSNFTQYVQFLHKADYGVGWLWNKIQSHPVLANDTILICMPEHGRNQQPNSLVDNNGLKAYDHTSDDNSRRVFALVVGPLGKVVQNQVLGSTSSPVGESIDIVPTIAHILGFHDQIPAGLLPGRPLTEAFV